MSEPIFTGKLDDLVIQPTSENIKVGDTIVITGLDPIHPKWWQFWRAPVDPNGSFVISAVVPTEKPEKAK